MDAEIQRPWMANRNLSRCLISIDATDLCRPWTMDTGIPASMTAFLARQDLCITASGDSGNDQKMNIIKEKTHEKFA